MRQGARRRKMVSSTIPNANIASFSRGHGRVGVKMNENLRTALFYLFALTLTWFIFCFLTFLYFTSSTHSDDVEHQREIIKSGYDTQNRKVYKEEKKEVDSIVNVDMESELDEFRPPTVRIKQIPKLDSPFANDTKSMDPDPLSPGHPCWGLCPPSLAHSQIQLDYVVLTVQKYLRHNSLKSHSKSYSPRPFQKHHKFGKVLSNMTKASLPAGGPRLRIILHTSDGARFLFRPETVEGNTTDMNSDYDQMEISMLEDHCKVFSQYTSDLAAYYFSLLLPIVNVPMITGFKLNISQIWPKRDKFFIDHSWISPADGALCFRGNCKRCPLPICVSPSTTLPGALSHWIPPASFPKFENPWTDSCTKRGTELWRTNADFCHNPTLMSKYSFFNSSTDPRIGLLRLIDTAIFDYLIDFPDRHFLHYTPGPSNQKGFLLFENGKSFADPRHSDTSILAPLFQCCQIDKNTWNLLSQLASPYDAEKANGHHYSPTSQFMVQFQTIMATDPFFPFLHFEHLEAVERRLLKVLAIVDLCIERYGKTSVIR